MGPYQLLVGLQLHLKGLLYNASYNVCKDI